MNATTSKVIITPNHLALLDPPAESVASLLTYRRRGCKAGGPRGWREYSEPVRAYSSDFRGRMCFGAGLLPRVCEVLEAQGHAVEIEDQRDSLPPLAVERDVLDMASAQEQMMLESMSEHPQGQLEVPPQRAVDRCSLIASAFPEARIVMLAPNRKTAQRIWQTLDLVLRERVGLQTTHVHRGGRCTVATFVGALGLAGRRRDILLLVDGDRSTGAAAVQAIVESQASRVYALVTPNRCRDSAQQLRLEQLAGPVIAAIRKPRSPVSVIFAEAPSEQQDADAASPLERKRGWYWSNAVRNKRIAEIALAAAAGDQQGLRRLLSADVRLEPICGYRPPRVAVLVETVEHARQLAELLPGWPMLSGVGVVQAPDQIDPGSRRAGYIVSAIYAAEHKLTVEALIRASGGEGVVRVKGFPPATDYGYTPPPVLLIDFTDQFAKPAAATARRRARDYRQAGMLVYTPPSMETPAYIQGRLIKCAPGLGRH